MIPGVSTTCRFGFFVAMLLLGAALPLGEGCSPCPEFDPAPEYRILNEDSRWVTGSGRLRVTDDAFVLSYETPDGSKWEVEYQRTAEPLPAP